MGANTFFTTGQGKTASEAFRNAVEKAQYESGHGGYTGTIAEKGHFVEITVPKGKVPGEYADELIEKDDPRVSDKWGPAGCILLESKAIQKKVNVPQKASKASAENMVFKGTRKWVTYYVLYANNQEIGKREKKNDALKLAKEWSLKHDSHVSIHLEKRLEGSSSLVAKVKPNRPKAKTVVQKETVNTYLFFGWASS